MSTFHDLSFFTTTPGPFAHPAFAPTDTPGTSSANVLCVGAGGLGCEILKCLALSGFKNISVIDMDTIESSNLNRQFLFAPTDVGRYKAQAAADSIKRRFPDINISHFNCRIEEMTLEWYSSFDVIISGLDSITARRHLNSTVVDVFRSFEKIVPLVDGGCEGFDGSYRVIVPTHTPCMSCIDLYPPAERFPICTLANRPRAPEHCVEYAAFHLWPEQHPETNFDLENSEHLNILMKMANNHCQEFGLELVTERMVESVVKNVIPAVASTNALVASICVFESVKIVTCIYGILNNFGMYRASSSKSGIYSSMMPLQRNEYCLVCGIQNTRIKVSIDITLSQFVDMLSQGVDSIQGGAELSSPSVSLGEEPLYVGALKRQFSDGMDKKVVELVGDQSVTVTDINLDNAVIVTFEFE
ncbi:hypothetical protein GEMRC1_003544 [Eukaryota sp. GEM-RC1]